MVVDHADGLEVRVDDRGTDEGEPARFQVPGDEVRELGARRDLLLTGPCVDHGFAARPFPEVGVEAAELLLDFRYRFALLMENRSSPVADDALVREQALHVTRGKPGNAPRVECRGMPSCIRPAASGW